MNSKSLQQFFGPSLKLFLAKLAAAFVLSFLFAWPAFYGHKIISVASYNGMQGRWMAFGSPLVYSAVREGCEPFTVLGATCINYNNNIALIFDLIFWYVFVFIIVCLLHSAYRSFRKKL